MTISTRCWRAVAVLVALQAALVALALAGLARADEPVGPTLRILLSVPRHTSDHAEEDGTRRARLEGIADAIDTATPHAHERALLLAQGWHESRWATFVHLDLPRCAEGHQGWCDHGRAWSPWQLHGTDRSHDMSWAAARAIALLRYYARRCGAPGLTTNRSVKAGLSGYATGGRLCSWRGADERVRTWRGYLARMGGGS